LIAHSLGGILIEQVSFSNLTATPSNTYVS